MQGSKTSRQFVSTQSKYRNSKIETDEGMFDSKKEYNRWLELKEMQANGDITNLARQISYELIPSQKLPEAVTIKRGKHRMTERRVTYVADFVYKDRRGRTIVEDTKGLKTKEYIIKRKLMLYRYGIQIKET